MRVDVRELRQAKMSLWTHDRCSQSQFWGRAVRNDSQLCAGYVSGYITACQVHTPLIGVLSVLTNGQAQLAELLTIEV